MVYEFAPDYTYECKLVRVIDGDTVVLLVDLGFKIQNELTVRLSDFNAPEPRGATKEEGLKYKEKAQRYFEDHPGPFFVTTTKSGKYGRWLGRIFVNHPHPSTVPPPPVMYKEDGITQFYLSDYLRRTWKNERG